MGTSDLLRVQDVRDAYRLIGECRDLGSDPALWHSRMLEGVWQLIGAPAATGGEGRWVRGPISTGTAFDAGLDACNRELYTAYRRELGPAGNPIWRVLLNVAGRLVTRSRRQLVSDIEWYRSVVFNEYRRPGKIDHQLTSVYKTSDDGAYSVITVVRALGERDFSPREQRLLNFFHAEVGPLIGRALVSATEPSPVKLSPRLRQTLAYLLEGDGEKQVADRLGLSHDTTHQYVKELYRHFGVGSRAQLMAYVLKRIGRGQWRQFPPGIARPSQ
jgi:DNA-binding CsgD family transcriptional regulator